MSTENNKNKIEALKAKAAKAASTAQRRALITAFYELIRSGAEVKMFNEDLQKDIYINNKSLKETRGHAGRYNDSTRAVFELLDILKNAKKVKVEEIKQDNKYQKEFSKMIILKDYIEGIGEVKLTVGVTKVDSKHIQYCLTAIK